MNHPNRTVVHKTVSGNEAWALAWRIADERGTRSPSARFFSAMNDDRYEILLDGEIVPDAISRLVMKVTVVTEPGCITEYLRTLHLGEIEVPLRNRPMVSARGGITRIGRHVVGIRERLGKAA